MDDEHGATGGASLAHSSAPAADLASRGLPDHSSTTSLDDSPAEGDLGTTTPGARPDATTGRAGGGTATAEAGLAAPGHDVPAAAGRHRRVFRRQQDPGRLPGPLGHQAIRALLGAQIVSAAGDQVARVAVAVLVYQLTGSALITAGAYALTYLPPLIGVRSAGRVGAAIGRRSVIIGTDLVRAVLIAVMALPGIRLPGLFALLACATALGPIYTAAHAGFLREHSASGTAPQPGPARTAIIYQACQALGFLAGGVLVAALQPRHALVIDALTFVVSALVIDLLARPGTATPAAAEFSGPADHQQPAATQAAGSDPVQTGGQSHRGSQVRLGGQPDPGGASQAGHAPHPSGSGQPRGTAQQPDPAANRQAGQPARPGRRAAGAAAPRLAAESALRVVLRTLLTAHPGARIVARNRKLRILTMFGWLAGCYAVPECLAVPYARSLGGGPLTAGLLMAAMPVGAGLGTLALSGLFGRRDRMSLLSDRALLACLPLIACALRPPLWAVVALWMLSGIGASYQLEALAAFLRELTAAARGRRTRAAAGHARPANRPRAAGHAAGDAAASPSEPAATSRTGQNAPAGQSVPPARRWPAAAQGLAVASAGVAGGVTGGAPSAAGDPAARTLAFVQGGMLTAQCVGFAGAGALAQLAGPPQAVAAAGLAGLITAGILARAWRRALLSPGRPRAGRAGVPGRRSARTDRGTGGREASRSGSC